MSDKKRVVITGMGAVTPVGKTMQETWDGILSGERKGSEISRFDASGFPSNLAYEVDDFKLNEDVLETGEREMLNTASGYTINAAVEAMHQAGIDSKISDAEAFRRAVCLGVGMFSPDFKWFTDVYLEKAFDADVIKEHVKYNPNTVGQIVARIMKARGGNTTIHTACASSGQSLGEAFEMVAYGESDVVLTGGADSMINPFHTAGFCLLGALSKRNDDPLSASRPFDVEREGFVLGEGACVFIFEEYEHAKRRGAKILGEVCGYGITESAYRITDLHPEGVGPIEAMQMALEDAEISPQKIGYINAHGTSTHLNDKCESFAISKTFEGNDDLHVSSTKSMTGHLISAAGAIEFATCVLALQDQVLPPTVNVSEQDPECEIKLTPDKSTPKSMEYALSNSIGFGGSNTALVARRV